MKTLKIPLFLFLSLAPIFVFVGTTGACDNPSCYGKESLPTAFSLNDYSHFPSPQNQTLQLAQATKIQRTQATQVQRTQAGSLRVRTGSSHNNIKDVPYKITTSSAVQANVTRMVAKPAAGQTAQMRKLPLYDLPFFANDLAPGERYYRGKKIHSDSGTQKWGYDLGAMRWNSKNGTWSEVKPGTDWKKPKNSDYFVFGQRVYAMGSGRVIRCWRNAPENPRPFSSALGDNFNDDFEDRDWLHQAWRDKKMSGGGNHLLVEETDGDLILYAHAQPGSIPGNLCPNNAALYSKPDNDSEAGVPKNKQSQIKAGDFLFKVGNSGNSSAPHLHVHMQNPSKNPLQLRFRRGLSTKVNGNKANINDWTRFAGQRIPSGSVLFWPPRKLGAEYARHGFPAGNFQRMFDHLADSGYWLEWIDAYSVGGNAYLNYVWRPAKGAWKAYFLLTPQTYQKRFNEAAAASYAPIQVESSLVKGKPRYSVIFSKKNPGKWLARHGLTYDQHEAVMNQAKGKNLYPVNVSVVSVGGQRRYTVLYRSDNIGKWQMKSSVSEAGYQTLYNTNAKAGRRPFYVNAYMHQSKPYFSVIFAQKPTGQRKDRHAMTGNKYQQEYNNALKGGLLTRTVSGYDGAKSNHRFIASWRK